MTQPNYPAQQQPAPYDDEIDLFELIESLWQQKVLIIVMTAIVTLGGALFAWLKPLDPVTYQATGLVEIGVYVSRNGGSQVFENPGDIALMVGQQAGVAANQPTGTTKLLQFSSTQVEAEMAEFAVQQSIDIVLLRHAGLERIFDPEQILRTLPTVQVGAVQLSTIPPKDSRKLIVALAFVLGGMLGVFAALIRNAIKKRRAS